MLIISGTGAPKLGRKIANEAHSGVLEFQTKKFPDGERFIRITGDCDGQVVAIIQSTFKDPDGLLMEFVMLADAVRGAGASKIIGVFPYLAYLRQDKRFEHGEVLSSQIFARLIESSGTSELLVVDPHLHRVRALSQLFTVPAASLSAMPDLAAYTARNFRLASPLVIAPDTEASQWASKVASALGIDYVVADKTRTGDASVEINFEGPPINGRDILLVDDIVSTGGTLANMATKLKKRGARRIIVLVTHVLLAAGAYDRMRNSGINLVVATDTVPNNYGVVSVAPMLAKSILQRK